MANKLFQPIADILVRRGLAASLEEAVEMVRAGKIVVNERGGYDNTRGFCPLRPTVVTDPNTKYRFNEPILAPSKLSSGKRVPRSEFELRTSSTLALTPQDIRFLKSLRIATDDDSASPDSTVGGRGG